ncbi:MAG: hypothetical protein IPP72_20140 [Chitinophagaceae bacterium]|nr:hypothetical protein [Chitinophagaceae bacterium]
MVASCFMQRKNNGLAMKGQREMLSGKWREGVTGSFCKLINCPCKRIVFGCKVNMDETIARTSTSDDRTADEKDEAD